MRFIAVLTLAALGLSACSAGEDSLPDEPEAAEVESEAAEVEPDSDPEVDGEERRPSAVERREATLERQRQERQEQQEREAQQECELEVGRDAEEFDLLTVAATTSDLSNFGTSGSQLTLTFSSCVSPGSVPVVRFDRTHAAECSDSRVECLIDGGAVTMTWPGVSSYRQDLTDTSVIDVLNTTDVNGDPVRVTDPVPVTESEPEPGPESLPELTQEVAQQELADVAQRIAAAWLDGASDFTELDEELMSEAQLLVDEHAPFEAGDTSDDWRHQLIWLSETGISELGGDWSPQINFTAFTRIGIPGVPATIFGGAHEVGDTWAPDVVVPGTYVTHDVDGCYWERLDNAADIIENNFINAAPRVEVTIRSSDFAFNSEGCGRWAQTDY